MRLAALLLLALATLTGCFTLQARIPEEAVRLHMAQDDDIDIGAVCSESGQRYSEGAVVCMVDTRLTCDHTGRWVPAEGGC